MKLKKLVVALGAIILLAGCSNVLDPPEAPAGRSGAVTLTVGQGERTVFPSIAQFSRISLKFETLDGNDVEDVDLVNGSITLSLPVGEWDVTANAYIDDVLAAKSEPGKNVLKWTGIGTDSVTGERSFVLLPTGTGEGTLKGVITIPVGINPGPASRITVTDLSDDTVVHGPAPITVSATVTKDLDAGRYFVDMILENGDGGPTAVFQRTVVILSGLTTDLSFKPAAADFLSGEDRAALSSVSSLVFGPTANNTANIEVDTDDFVNGKILISAPGGTAAVYFTVGNPDGLILSPGSNVAAEPGAVDGSTPSDILSVFKVDTTAYSVNGGGTTVYLTAAQAAMEGVSIEVTVIVKPNLTAEVLFGSTAASSEVIATPDWDEEDAVGNLAVSGAVEKNTVFFTASKAAAQDLVPTGDDAAKVTVHTEGVVDGETASETWAVIEVDTRGLVFDGGERTFALEVRETDALPRTVNVTLDLATRKTGAAAFKVTRPEGDIYNSSWDRATLERLDTGGVPSFTGFTEAMAWVEDNAVGNSEYLIRVEKSESNLPRFIVTFDYREDNITLRLRGDKDGPHALQKGNNNTVVGNKNKITANNYSGFFAIGPPFSIYKEEVGTEYFTPKRTFILGNNITLKGLGNTAYTYNYYIRAALSVSCGAMAVMEKGSLITDWFNTSSSLGTVPIYMPPDAAFSYKGYGYLRIEGGGITNSNVHANFGMIEVPEGTQSEKRPAGSFYKAASTPENPIVFTENNYNYVRIGNNKINLSEETGELSLPLPAED